MDYAEGEGMHFFLTDDQLYGQKAGILLRDKNSAQRAYLGYSANGETMLIMDSPNKGRVSSIIDSLGIYNLTHDTYAKDNIKTKTIIESKIE